MTTTMKLTLKELANKITPGPWEARKLEADGFVIRGGKEGWEIFTPEYDVVADVQYGAPIRKQADAEAIALVPGLLRVSEAMAEALRSVFSNIGRFDHASDMGNHYVRCKYCDVIGTFAPGKSTGHIPHKDDCLIKIAEAALAEWEKLRK